MGVKEFLRLPSFQQTEYLKNAEFLQLPCKKKTAFLKAILIEDNHVETIISSLSLLIQFNDPDRYFFKKFLYHRNNDVVEVAKKAISKLNRKKKSSADVLSMLREGHCDDRILLANFFLEQEGKLDVHTLISFLKINSVRLREMIVKKITPAHELDEKRIVEMIKKGVAWYVRAALVEILGNRNSQYLLEIIDYLMKDSNVEVKLKLIDALLKIELENAKIYLQKLSHDPIIWVRKYASQAIIKS